MAWSTYVAIGDSLTAGRGDEGRDGRPIGWAQRFVDLYLAAADTAGLPDDPAFREALRSHVEFGSQVAMQNSHAQTDDQLHPLREVPKWTWSGG